MAEKAENANRMNIKVLIYKKTQRILYAEAGKEFVDLLLSFLLLPSGTVVKVLSDTEVSKSVGCITNIYDSVDKLPQVYMDGRKSDLLQPSIAPGSANAMLPIQYLDPNTYYVCSQHCRRGYCSNCGRYSSGASSGYHRVSRESGQTCSCGEVMRTEVRLASPPSGTVGGGYVREQITYIITDDLVIAPSSTTTSIAILNKFQVNDLAELEERTIAVGPDEVLHLLRASLVSKSALNEVFSDPLKLRSLIKQLSKRSSWE